MDLIGRRRRDRPAGPPATACAAVPAPAVPAPAGVDRAPAVPRGRAEVPDVPLVEVPFAVVDVETTGGSAAHNFLTEVAVAVFVGGRRVAVFDQLVDPGVPIPPFISSLTGISDATVAGAPPIADVLPELCRHLAGCVLVGHNLPFDVSFLDAALVANDLAPLDQLRVDTLVLARRLLHGAVPNFKLGTLAATLALPNQPSHRALADVLATADLLHWQLGRLAPAGVLRLPQLLAVGGRGSGATGAPCRA